MVDSNKLALLGIYFAIFTHSLMFSVYFPVSNLMVTEYDLAETKSKTGEHIGKISFWYLIGEFLSFPLFIWLMGRVGCRLVLLFTIVSSSLSALYLASCDDYDALVTIRFFQGLICPVPLVAGRILMTFFPRNIKKVPIFIQRFTLLGFAFGFMIGGAWYGKSFLGKSKYLKSGLGVFISGICSFALCYLYVKDQRNGERTSFLRIFIETVQIFKVPGIVPATLVYMLCCVGKTAFELMIIWLWALLDDGGFNIKLVDLWKIMSLGCLSVLAYLFLYYQAVIDKLGYIESIKECIRFCACCLFVFPIFSFVKTEYTLMYIFMIIASFIYFTSLYISLNSLQCIVFNISEIKEGVQVTDVLFALGKISQALAVSSICTNFSKKADKDNDYPFNFAYVFNILGAIILGTYLLTFTLVDERKAKVNSQGVSSHESLLEPSLEALEIPVKSSEMKMISSSK